MSTNLYRGLILLANLVVLALIGLLGVRAYLGAKPDPAELPPDTFNPIQYEVSFNQQGRSSLLEHRVIWTQLDRPEPKSQVLPRAPINQQPTAQNLSSLYSLLMANYNEANKASSTVILQGRSGTLTLAIGDQLPDGFEVSSIEVRGEGDGREAIVTVRRDGQQHQITLRRSQNK